MRTFRPMYGPAQVLRYTLVFQVQTGRIIGLMKDVHPDLFKQATIEFAVPDVHPSFDAEVRYHKIFLRVKKYALSPRRNGGQHEVVYILLSDRPVVELRRIEQFRGGI